eukprot:CAMPEP_0185582590 /NCGR_PEP_ID=MMETSP0434-20130131/20995_1 /TAXON_ID=626734 ORGANISM="Favella taraikaensis, Strain Fe Narragansett Bay" /NCGR_SAMPLE_ID=MMETSP0434 /ASSEMBLY_ACC=CAM_ASM_000379 /LENGTH=73 /DNA_ID=CAMNT_0028201447 /DNA_START=585 /DNA_END=806 /DNA_ORIENTATION=-
MPELIQAKALGQHHLHHLPMPVTSTPKRPNWAAHKQQNALQKAPEPRDNMLWKNLPAEVKADERNRMHAVFFF